MLAAISSQQSLFWQTSGASGAVSSQQIGKTVAQTAETSTSDASSSTAAAETTASTQTGSDTNQASAIAALKSTDQNVRAHEAAHLAAAGGLATGGAQFTYETGPDGVRYAVGGEVSISVSEGQTPEETLQRAEQIRRAALAPADPSSQDLAVAAMAEQMAARARQQIASEQAGAYSQEDTAKGSLINTSA